MEKGFVGSGRKHVLMITNHGVHEWRVVPGLPDTGGQNVFVNQFSAALARLGFKITIVNRGGYLHPRTGQERVGLDYKDEQQRILYLDDGLAEFVRKEDMGQRIPYLAAELYKFLDAEGTPVDLILSHYWDGAKIGVLYNRALAERARHVWVPHSLGAIKKRNVLAERWADLRVDERIATEKGLLRDLTCPGGQCQGDGVAATSSAVRQSLEGDYGYAGPISFLPPCVDTERYHPRQVSDEDPVWDFLSQRCGLPPEKVRQAKIITEISRTDSTKRKDVLLRAFARAGQRVPNILLVLSIDDARAELAGGLKGLIQALDLQDRVIVVGSVWDMLPTLYAITDVYCTPSVMEGFGMSAQEAAATGVPVVASHLVPFVTEYLLGEQARSLLNSAHRVGNTAPSPLWGGGAIVVQADDVPGFALALEMLLTSDDFRREMGKRAYHITVPFFTWRNRVLAFLNEIGGEFTHEATA
jgi:glycosyltransferase involved in cell wall biosynthesis